MKIDGCDVQTDGRMLWWVGDMSVEADGAPNAYAPLGSGLRALDDLRNAGRKGDWYGLACDDAGEPYVQVAGDPFPGFFVAATALVDPTKKIRDPRRYVDASKVPFIALPPEVFNMGARKGDLAVVECGGLRSGAIVAEVGPRRKIGEGSIALAEALGIPASPINGGCPDGVLYRVFLGTTAMPRWPRPGFEAEALALLGPT